MLTDAERAVLTRRLRRGREPAAIRIPRRPDGLAELPLSFGQEQLWFIDQLTPGQATYNIPLAIALTGPLSAVALGQALDDLVARHEALRTRLVAGPGGQPVQQVDPPGHPVQRPDPPGQPSQRVSRAGPRGLTVTDLSAMLPADRADRLTRLIETESLRPFDLAAGPLLRTSLVRTGADQHILLVVVHHAVFDGWSSRVLVSDLAALYGRRHLGQAGPGLPELPIQFADYALWERGRLAGRTLERLQEYWRTMLAGFSQVEFPADRPRPVLEDFAGGLVTLQADADLLAALRQFSRTEGTTVFVTLLAALFALLHRYTGQDDLIAGTITASRSRAELEPLIGFLVNTLPIRADMSGDPPFTELLGRVREAATGAYGHQELPFAGIVDALAVERDPGRSPLFQIDLVYADRDTAPVTAAGVKFTLTDLVVGIKAAKFDIELHAEARPAGLWVECSYKTALFDEDTMARMLRHYEVLLRGIVADPAARLSRLPLLTKAELDREIRQWNDTAGPYPAHCIHQGFEAQAALVPDAIAAVYEDQAVSYAELDQMANRIARRLRSAGVGPEVLTGICMPAGIPRLAAVLAILKAGGGYVPLDPALPAERLAFMIADTAMPLIVTDEGSAGRLPESGAALLKLDAEWPAISALNDTACGAAAEPAGVAYVIYTSGSTGKPKGVVLEHRQVVNFAHSLISHFEVGEADAVLGFASLSFDVSVFDMFVPLLAGARVVLAPVEVLHSPPRLGALIRNARISYACVTPSVLSLITSQEFPDLRIMMTAGEELPGELATAWLRPGLRMVNGYGPTETTVVCTFCELDASTPMPPPIGRAMYPNYTCYVLDRYLNPVPVGVTGELHIGGVSVARGYLNRPELTGQRFIPDPFVPGGRLYKSGDLCRRNADGTISFVGRADFQVKLRGLRIELGEIEAALAGHPCVAQAFVAVTTGQAGDKELAGYYRRAGQAGSVPDAELRAHLARTLPGYMVPAHLIEVEAFPLNNNNKIDVAALPRPDGGAAECGLRREAPKTALEATLSGLFARVLNLDEVGASDSFFQIGGNSLQVMRLLDLVHRETGAALPAASVFLHPTPRKLATAVEAAASGSAAPRGPACLVQLTAGPGELPLILIHPVGGTVFAYSTLAAELADMFAVRGLESPALSDAGAPWAATIADLADDYAERIRSVQPAGPYRLAGWSMGGVLAFEVARQLEDAGAEVDLLVLLDAPFDGPARQDWTEAERTGQFVADAALSLGWDTAGLPSPGSADEQLTWLAGQLGGDTPPSGDAQAGGASPAGGDMLLRQLRRRYEVFGANYRLLSGYRPGERGVRAPTLIVSADRSLNAPARSRWPAQLDGPVQVCPVDSDHYGFLRPPFAAEVAATIAAWHDKTGAGTAPYADRAR